MLSTWWLWAIAGLVFGILEVVAPTYILLGFAIGAGLVSIGLVTGLMSAVLTSAYTVPTLLVIFAVLSLVAWIALRLAFGKAGQAAQTFDRDVND